MSHLLRDVWELIPVDGWQRLMVDAVWQSTLISTLALIAIRGWRGQATARAWLLLVTLVACLVAPATSFLARSAGLALPIPPLASSMDTTMTVDDSMRRSASPVVALQQPDWRKEQADAPPRTNHALPSFGRTTDGESSQAWSAPQRAFASAQGRQLVQDLLIAAALVWFMATSWIVIRMVRSWACVLRLIRESRTCEDSSVRQATLRATHRLALKREPRVLMSDKVAMPMVLAYFRPMLLIPATAVGAHTEAHWETVIAHELAHVRRHDGWARLAVQTIAMLLPLQPLIWRVRALFLEACEEACDDWAVATGDDPLDLASVLTTWADPAGRPPELMLAVGVSTTRSRVLRLIAMDESPSVLLPVRYQTGSVLTGLFVCGSIALAQSPATPPIANTSAQNEVTSPEVDTNSQSDAATMSLSGTCVDENNEPIPGALIRLFYYGPFAGDHRRDAQVEVQNVRCDEKGAFVLLNVPTQRDEFHLWYVIAQHPGKATTTHRLRVKDTGTQSVRMKLTPAVSLRGRVVNEAGQSVSGAIVSAGSPLMFRIPGICADVSDEEGRYEISDLRPFSLAGQVAQSADDGESKWVISAYFAEVEHGDYARQRFPVEAIPGDTDVTLQRPAIVEGVVTLDHSDAPAAGARLEFWNDTISPDHWTRVTTDSTGHYKIGILPPGDYRLSVRFEGRPNLFLPSLKIQSGMNRQDLTLETGAIIRGRVVDVTTDQTIQLQDDETMSITEVIGGTSFAGGPHAMIQRDGTFTLQAPAGRRRFGLYFGKNWRGVNTDRLVNEGIELVEGETIELEIRVKPATPAARPEMSKPLPPVAADSLSEQAAVAAIKELGGWVEKEKIKGVERVVEVNMVYHEDAKLGRLENSIYSDESLSYAPKFQHLRFLGLHGAQISDDALVNLRGMEHLEQVYLWDATFLSDKGVAHLATLENLKTIHINNSQITDESLRLFSQLPNLECLSLQGNHFTDKGLEYVRSMTQLKQLVVGLGDNQITDDGLKHVSGLKNLERICLQGSKITDHGLRHLSGLKKLNDLWVGNTAVTEGGLRSLSKELPNLKYLK